ncbi:hypothetical protein F4809DRAFT_608022 [Biscogniauxia mediterranea]|nr:hypothetical protein F4809DRAFT_608022 [Biscogniauxia mediterranea]
MSHQPSTPVKVPNSATNYTPATLDPDLRSQINTLLLREGHINKIQEHLLHSLDAHSANWPSAIQSHALALLRSGEVSTFPALIRRVLEDVRHDTAAAAAAAEAEAADGSNNSNNNTKNGAGAGSGSGSEKNGSGGSEVNGSAAAAAATPNGNSNNSKNGAGGTADANLAIPTAVVEAVLKVARESLEAVCEIDDGATGG